MGFEIRVFENEVFDATAHSKKPIWGHDRRRRMLWHFPPTPRQLAATAGVFTLGVSLIAVGTHLSHANIAPQRAHAEARRQFVEEYFRKKFDC